MTVKANEEIISQNASNMWYGSGIAGCTCMNLKPETLIQVAITENPLKLDSDEDPTPTRFS